MPASTAGAIGERGEGAGRIRGPWRIGGHVPAFSFGVLLLVSRLIESGQSALAVCYHSERGFVLLVNTL